MIAQAIAAAEAHAVREFPSESCGFIAGNRYVACFNKNTALDEFRIQDSRYDAAVIRKSLQAVVHSHPNGRDVPSPRDLTQQAATAVPWLIIALTETGIVSIRQFGGAA